MHTIRDLVGALAHRQGVDAVIVLGRDGILIDSETFEGGAVDTESIAALIPSVIAAADDVGASAARGQLLTAILEYPLGIGMISVLTGEAILLVLVHPGANVGSLLFELRRYREQIAALV
ncbi:MAG: roadblock/LC7 domain-containing protein [Gemmatimonadaceae bacterium]